MYHFLFVCLDQGTSCRRSFKNFEQGSFDWKLKGLVPFLTVESNWRDTYPPPTPTVSLNTFNRNFEISILFSIVERSRDYVFEDDNPPPPTALRARVVSYALGAFKVCIERAIVETLEGAHWIDNQKSKCPFSRRHRVYQPYSC